MSGRKVTSVTVRGLVRDDVLALADTLRALVAELDAMNGSHAAPRRMTLESDSAGDLNVIVLAVRP